MRIRAAHLDEHGILLSVLLDAFPTRRDLVYTAYPYHEHHPSSDAVTERGTLYLAKDPSGYVDVIAADTNNPQATDGATFEVRLSDGSTRLVTGAWVPYPEVVNHLVPDADVYCGLTIYYEDAEAYENGVGEALSDGYLTNHAVRAAFGLPEPPDGMGNEDRADLGLDAVLAAAVETNVHVAEDARTAVTDALSYIAHSCDRLGVDPDEVFADALASYRGDFEDGPRAARTMDAARSLSEQMDAASLIRASRQERAEDADGATITDRDVTADADVLSSVNEQIDPLTFALGVRQGLVLGGADDGAADHAASAAFIQAEVHNTQVRAAAAGVTLTPHRAETATRDPAEIGPAAAAQREPDQPRHRMGAGEPAREDGDNEQRRAGAAAEVARAASADPAAGAVTLAPPQHDPPPAAQAPPPYRGLER